MVDSDGFLRSLGLVTYTSTKIHRVPLPSTILTLQPPPTKKENEI